MPFEANFGDLDPIWGLGALERVLAAQGKVAETSKKWMLSLLRSEPCSNTFFLRHEQLVAFLNDRPRLCSPRMLRELLLWPNETTTRTLTRVDVASDPTDDVPLSSKIRDESVFRCNMCGNRGIERALKTCGELSHDAAPSTLADVHALFTASCFTTRSCGKDCQRLDWKGARRFGCYLT